MAAESLRLFVAIEMPEAIRKRLASVIGELRRDLHGPFRWVAPELVHLTLKFLGQVDADRVESLVAALRSAVAPFPAFDLRLEGMGTFPERGSPRVVWAGLGGEVAVLHDLQQAVEESMVAAGEAPQENEFRPHLTLARVRDTLPRAEAAALQERLQAVQFGPDATFMVREVGLIRSTLTSKGPIYRTLAVAALSE